MILDGVKVIELALWGFVPRAGVHLADLGADVIKVEHPERGDAFRSWRVLQGKRLPPFPIHFGYEVFNRNKRNIALDAATPEGKEIVHRLLRRADVFLVSLRPRVLERLGYDYESVARINPQIIYAQGTGWGLKGKWRDRAAFGPAIWAASGMASILGEPGTPPPQAPPATNDLVAGMTLAMGILAALYHRQQTGQGQRVHTSLLATSLDMGAYLLQAQLFHGGEIPRIDRRQVANPLFNIYRTKDGEWLQFMAPQFDRYWPQLCSALGLEHLKEDLRFKFESLSQNRNNETLISILDQAFGSKTLGEWEEVLGNYPDIPWASVKTFAQVAVDAAVVANELITEFPHPRLGRVKLVSPPLQFSQTPAQLRRPAPECGEHTEEVLQELGYSREEMERLKERKAIF